MYKYSLILTLCFVCLHVFADSLSDLDLVNFNINTLTYNKISLCTSYKALLNIFKKPGFGAFSEKQGDPITNYQWEDSNGNEIYVEMKNDKVTFKEIFMPHVLFLSKPDINKPSYNCH